MRPEPDIDTIDVKGMRTNGKNTNAIVVFELQQTNGAVTTIIHEAMLAQPFGSVQ